jgi:hypothetical protein
MLEQYQFLYMVMGFPFQEQWKVNIKLFGVLSEMVSGTTLWKLICS